MKRLLLLIFTLMLCNFNFAFAKNYDISQISQAKLVTSYSEDTTVDQMDTVTFGSYYQSNSSTKEPIEWIVLDRQGEKTLLLSKYILDCKPYNQEYINITWENCYLRKWLNEFFIDNAFNSKEQKRIETTDLVNNYNNPKYGTNGGNNTSDKIFLLSIDEVVKYFWQPTMSDDNKRLATRGTEYAKSKDKTGYFLDFSSSKQWDDGNSIFWLRLPGDDMRDTTDIYGNGSLELSGRFSDGAQGVRPAIWISTYKNTGLSAKSILKSMVIITVLLIIIIIYRNKMKLIINKLIK